MKPKLKSAGRFSPAFLFGQCKTHPATKMLVLMLMVVCIPRLQPNQLLALGLLLSAGLVYFRVSRFFLMLRRMRWLFISMVLIYSYTTPGQYLANWPIDLAPTYEGLSQGMLQIAKICLVLAGISLLMATSTKEALMVGVYSIIQPLKYLGLHPERFTARLFLTMQYIEASESKPKLQDGQSVWQRILSFRLETLENASTKESVSLDIPKFGFVDYLFIALVLILIGRYS